jgi:hypothetical protein
MSTLPHLLSHFLYPDEYLPYFNIKIFLNLDLFIMPMFTLAYSIKKITLQFQWRPGELGKTECSPVLFFGGEIYLARLKYMPGANLARFISIVVEK